MKEVYGKLVSQGTPVNLNRLTSVNTAQESLGNQ